MAAGKISKTKIFPVTRLSRPMIMRIRRLYLSANQQFHISCTRFAMKARARHGVGKISIKTLNGFWRP